MNTKELNEFAAKVHSANTLWWTDLKTGKPYIRNRGEILMLVITELAEAMEGIRKGLMDDKLPHRRMEEVELADAVIRMFDAAGGYGIELDDTPFSVPADNKGEALLAICYNLGIARHSDMMFNIALQMMFAYCETYGLDLLGALREKMAYNANREDHKLEARKADGGKKF